MGYGSSENEASANNSISLFVAQDIGAEGDNCGSEMA
jgi:hypothetical protein